MISFELLKPELCCLLSKKSNQLQVERDFYPSHVFHVARNKKKQQDENCDSHSSMWNIQLCSQMVTLILQNYASETNLTF